MRFDIKKWQDKYLIKEAKLKELDFKDQEAFKKYSSQHKIQPSTQVTIAGKTTTAGEASGEEKPKAWEPPRKADGSVDWDAMANDPNPRWNFLRQGTPQAGEDEGYFDDEDHEDGSRGGVDLQQTGAGESSSESKFQFSEYDYETPKEFRDQAKDILRKTYDLDKVDPDELEEIIKSADDYFYQEARSENKRGREVDPTSVEEYADYMDMAFENYGIEPKVEESKNVQEARIYRTIQQLRVLEKEI